MMVGYAVFRSWFGGLPPSSVSAFTFSGSLIGFFN
jgi:hypothetical protein